MGAERVNDMALAFMRDYVASHPEVCHLHACGSIELELCTKQFKEMGLDKYDNIKLVEYIFDMPLQMSAADVVISRAGAMTLSELAMQGKPCVLIPSPYVTGNHQYKNAKAIADKGGALLFEEKDLTDEGFVSGVSSLLESEEKRRAMSDAIRGFAKADAKKIIYQEIKRLVRN